MSFKLKIFGNIVALSFIMLLWQNCGKSKGFTPDTSAAQLSSESASDSDDDSSSDDSASPSPSPSASPSPSPSTSKYTCDQSKPETCLVRLSLGVYLTNTPSAKLHITYPSTSLKRFLCLKSDSNVCLADLRSAMIKVCGTRTAYFFSTPEQVKAFYKEHKLLAVNFTLLGSIFDEFTSLQISAAKTQVIHSGVNFLICYNK